MENLKKLEELIQSPIKNIKESNDMTIIEFENGQTMPLYGTTITKKYDYCDYCGISSVEKTLATINNKNYVCLNCITQLLQLFIQNGHEIKINLGEEFQELNEILSNISQHFKK